MHTLSKLIIILVMIRGRHRGLPVALDRAVLMPSEFLVTASSATQQPEQLQEDPTDEKDAHDHQDAELGDISRTLRDRDELEARIRMRTRTISLIVEEKRDSAHVTEKEVGTLPWLSEHIAEGSRGSSVEGSEGIDRAKVTG